MSLSLVKQLQYSVRSLTRSPGFLAVVVLSLGIGFGLNTMLFAAVQHLLIVRLPFPRAAELVTLWESNPRQERKELAVASGNFFDLQRLNSLAALVHFVDIRPALRIGDREDEVAGIQVSSGWNKITGTRPARGRDFDAEDYASGAPRVVILSDAAWKNWTGADERIVGKSIFLDGRPHAVIGVMPPGFVFPFPLLPDPVQVWVPSTITATGASRKFHGLYVVGRTRAGATFGQLQRDLRALSLQLQEQYPQTNRYWEFVAIPLQTTLVRNSKRLLFLLSGACVGILLLGTVNTSILWLGRIFQRRHELAVRLALGATSSRLLSELLTESVVVAIMGGLLGFALAMLSANLLNRLAIEGGLLRSSGSFHADLVTFGAVMLLAVVLGVVAGVLPAQRLIRSAIRDPLGDMQGRHSRIRVLSGGFGLLTVAQISVCATLLLAAVAFSDSYWHLAQSNVGRDTDKVTVARVRPPVSQMATQDQRIGFYASLLDAIGRLPDIDSAGALSAVSPPEGGELHFRPSAPRQIEQVDELGDLFVATPGVLETLGATMLSGRDLTVEDTRGRPAAVVVNESLVERCWPGEDAIGRTIVVQNMGTEPYTVVGVVRDIDHFNPNRRHRPEIYVSFLQKPFVYMWLIVHGKEDPSLLRSIQTAAWSLNRDVAVTSLNTFNNLQHRAMAQPQLQVILVGLTSGLASILAILGVYSMFSCFCAVQRREIVVRVALGAELKDVVGLLISKALILSFVGIAIAGGLTALMTPVLKSLIVDYQGVNFVATIGVIVSFLVVMLIATSVPAFRAAHVDPANFLKEAR